jgi:hypothetical protein
MRYLRNFAFILLLSAIPAAAQISYSSAVSDPTDTKRYSLSGTVVNSVTGEPLRRALVSVYYTQQLAVMTDADGRFEFEGLARGRTAVSAQKPGFFGEQELSGGRGRPSQFAVGPDAPAAVIKLVPEAIISGRIRDTDGLPIRGLIVRAVTQKVVQGRKEWQQGMIARTDADGEYRIINLMPGAYFLIAGPGRAPAFVTGPDDTSDLGYPAVTYPGNSVPLGINAGQQVETNFTVKPEPFYSVTGSVAGTSPGGRYQVQLLSRIPGVRMPIAMAAPDPESGTFTFPRVAGGDYILQVSGFNQDSRKTDAFQNQSFGSVPITVNRNLMGVTVSLEPALAIPINVRSERTRETPVNQGTRNFPGVQLRLMPVNQDRQPAFSNPQDPKDPSSPLVLRNATPGTYRVGLQPSFGDMYVSSARFGTTDLLNGEITLTSGASQGAIDIVLRDDAARLTVKAQSQDPVTGVSILLVPDRGEPRLSEANAGPNDTGAHIHGLRPGTYTVLAFDDVGNLEYMNRDALGPYLSHGARITLAPNQEATVTPELIKRGGE